ncbi:MAG TPA: substrate-binding domain-containing protein [Gaiellaceae bacterium]|nr:substrate-binding domain-containing protein [Gaiellaceae bacterium]
MVRRTVFATVAALSLAATAGALLAGPSGAAHPTYTIAFASDQASSPRVQAIARGARAAAKRLRVRFTVVGPSYAGPGDGFVSIFQSLIARHPDAIATEGFFPQMKPVLDKARLAGITLVASGDDIDAKRSLWIGQSSPVEYAHALADALASQMKGRGEYAIAREPGQFPIANEEQRLIEAYVAKTYPNMHLDAVISGADANGYPLFTSVQKFVTAHPQLKGMIGVVPRCAYSIAEAIIHTHKEGKVFSADNGGGSFGDPLPGYVRKGVAQIVFGGDPVKLGYLTVWATDYLLTGHRFRSGVYQVGGPIGLVSYYANHQELRLGQPLTMTNANVDLYANKF